MTTAAGVLEWNAAPSNIERFKQPAEALQTQTYGFQGYPERYMFSPKRPLRHQPSADIHNADVNRYFRKDPETFNGQNQPGPPSPGPGPRNDPPAWLQESQRDPGPAQPPKGTISPRYGDNNNYGRRTPVVRDPLRELTSAEKRKKIEEHYRAQEDLAEAKARRQEREREEMEEKRRFDPVNTDRASPDRHFRDRDRRIDAVKENMDRMRNGDYTDRSHIAEMLTENEREINNLKRSLAELERDRYAKDGTDRRQSDMIISQERKLRDMGEELKMLKSQVHDSYQPEVRAHSEPVTDRPMRRQRDRDFWGSSMDAPPDYLGISPRQPVGKWYNKESTYKKDFDRPEQRRGNRNLKNPNWESYEPFHPFGAQGGGAPLFDQGGHRNTKIKGTMRYIGREGSDSAKAKRAQKFDLLQTYERQLEEDRMKREQEKMMNRAGFTDFAEKMRHMQLGRPRYDETGMIGNHHLPHKMSSQTERPEESKKRTYYNELREQIEHRNAMDRLGKLEEKNQANAHFTNFDSFFGKDGGGNKKGPNLRKSNLIQSIHHTQDTPSYYHKVRLDDDDKPDDILERYKPRITINSTHKNLYEFPDGSLKTNYRGLAPYAAEFNNH